MEFKGTIGKWNTNLFSVFYGEEEKIGDNVICRLHLGLENYQKSEQRYNAELIAEAGNIRQQIPFSLTELKSQRDKMLEILKELKDRFEYFNDKVSVNEIEQLIKEATELNN